MKKKWLSLILNLSGVIYRQKEKIKETSPLETIGRAVALAFLECVLLVISLPTYFFVSSNKASIYHSENEAEKYHLRRRTTLTILLILLWILLLKFSISGLTEPGSAETSSFIVQLDWLTITLAALIVATTVALIRGGTKKE